MSFIFSTFLLALHITFYQTGAMPTDGMPKMPEDCINQTYCTSDTNYPHEVVDRLMKEQNLMSFTVKPNYFPTLGNREGIEYNDEIQPCETTEEREEIHYIIDEQNNVRVVAQSKARFRQFVPITRCKSSKPTNDTNMVKVDLANTYENIECREDKLNFNFVVLSPDFKSLEMARVNGGVPVGCECVYV